MKLRTVIVLSAALLIASPCLAYTVRGAGPCKDWVGGTDDRYWILGFLSGYNFAKNDQIMKGVDLKEIYSFITKYCKINPSDDLADASTAFINTH
jgi:hypothetical protein